MQEIDVLVRVTGAVLLLNSALLLVRDGGRNRVVWLFLLLALGVCGFLARNTPDQSLTLSGSSAVLASLLSGNAAVFLWWFSLAIFDDEFRLDRLKLGVGAAWFTVALLDRGLLTDRFSDAGLSWVLVVMGTGMVAHLAHHLLREREGDLVEPRRRARVALAAAPPALLLVDLAIDVAFGFGWRPRWFTIAQNAAILAFAIQITRWLLRAHAGALMFTPVGAPGPAPVAAYSFAGAAGLAAAASGAPPPNGRLLERLGRLMNSERIYRDPDLTFAEFAARMGGSEAEVRRLINQQLGYQHFRSFLNAYRVAEAREALVDPARAGQKMLALAFDVGFASLASFNRAFRLVEGRSPTDYRAERLAANGTQTGAAGLSQQRSGATTGF